MMRLMGIQKRMIWGVWLSISGRLNVVLISIPKGLIVLEGEMLFTEFTPHSVYFIDTVSILGQSATKSIFHDKN